MTRGRCSHLTQGRNGCSLSALRSTDFPCCTFLNPRLRHSPLRTLQNIALPTQPPELPKGLFESKKDSQEPKKAPTICQKPQLAESRLVELPTRLPGTQTMQPSNPKPKIRSPQEISTSLTQALRGRSSHLTHGRIGSILSHLMFKT